jgi:hypothetical protein
MGKRGAMSYRHNRRWSDAKLCLVKDILEKKTGFRYVEASSRDDTQDATDLVTYPDPHRGPRVAVRIRRIPCPPSWYEQFTIRSSIYTGRLTEFDKVVGGSADWFFYGFAEKESIPVWHLIDLKKLRSWIHRFAISHNGRIPAHEMTNKDHKTKFYVFNMYDGRFDFGAVVAHKYGRKESCQPGLFDHISQ